MKATLVYLFCANCREERLHHQLACCHCACINPIAFRGDTDVRQAKNVNGNTSYGKVTTGGKKLRGVSRL